MLFGMSGASSNTSFAVRFRPMGPWRFGPDSGARDRVDLIYHSDALYSAVCSAMSQLGLADAWFEATATAPSPAVRFSSLFPFVGDTMFSGWRKRMLDTVRVARPGAVPRGVAFQRRSGPAAPCGR